MYNYTEVSKRDLDTILGGLATADREQAELCVATWLGIAKDISDKVAALLRFVLMQFGFMESIKLLSKAADIFLEDQLVFEAVFGGGTEIGGAVQMLGRAIKAASSRPEHDLLLVFRFAKRFTPSGGPIGFKSKPVAPEQTAIANFMATNRRMKLFQRTPIPSFIEQEVQAINNEFSIDALIRQHLPATDVVRSNPYVALPKGVTAEGYKTRFEKVLGLSTSAVDLWDFPAVCLTDQSKYHRYTLDDISISRMVCVPKNFETMRTIAMEPVFTTVACTDISDALVKVCDGEVKYPRRSYARLYPGYESSHYGVGGHPLIPEDHIFLHDQGENRDAAEFAAATGLCATVDVSAASDSVSPTVVGMFFPSLMQPHILKRLTHIVDVPYHGEQQMHMYSTMGSRVTFPLESLIFLEIAFLAASILVPLGIGSWADFALVRVYGDDVVIPVVWAEMFIHLLRKLGFKPNYEKSFIAEEHPYRESCGAEFLRTDDGVVDVATSYWPRKVVKTTDLATLCKLHNALYSKGFEHACSQIKAVVGNRAPLVTTDDELGLLSLTPDYTLVMVPDILCDMPGILECKIDYGNGKTRDFIRELPYYAIPNGIVLGKSTKLVTDHKRVDYVMCGKRIQLSAQHIYNLYQLFAYHDTLCGAQRYYDSLCELLNVVEGRDLSTGREMVLVYDQDQGRYIPSQHLKGCVIPYWLG